MRPVGVIHVLGLCVGCRETFVFFGSGVTVQQKDVLEDQAVLF